MSFGAIQKKLQQKVCFRLRHSFGLRPVFRNFWWVAQGATFGSRTKVPRLAITWPHQLSIGDDCLIEDDVTFKYDGIWQSGPSIIVKDRVFIGRGCEFNICRRVVIGDDCLIASGCKFIDHDHGMVIGELMNIQVGPEAEILLESDVWLGVNVVVLKGVTIHSGSIIAAGAVVTKSIGVNEIWAGIPARKIGERSHRRKEPPTIVP